MSTRQETIVLSKVNRRNSYTYIVALGHRSQLKFISCPPRPTSSKQWIVCNRAPYGSQGRSRTRTNDVNSRIWIFCKSRYPSDFWRQAIGGRYDQMPEGTVQVLYIRGGRVAESGLPARVSWVSMRTPTRPVVALTLAFCSISLYTIIYFSWALLLCAYIPSNWLLYAFSICSARVSICEVYELSPSRKWKGKANQGVLRRQSCHGNAQRNDVSLRASWITLDACTKTSASILKLFSN
jgi:hypothetical protein